MQGYQQDIWLFGRRKGTGGQTIWEIKEQLGAISTKLHMEYSDYADPTHRRSSSLSTWEVWLWWLATPRNSTILQLRSAGAVC